MINNDECRELITGSFPELEIYSFSILGKGKSGIICLVNNEIVFKIPLQTKGEKAEWQKTEAEVLRFLENRMDKASQVNKISFEIPKILYTATAESGHFIIGETLLSGIPLTYELYDTFSEDIKAGILRQLGSIARCLHDSGGHDSSWMSNNYRESLDVYLNEFNDRFSGKVRSVFSSREINKIEETARYYETLYNEHTARPVLCHHDLHLANLMIDLDSKKITGLLDFGCAGYSEPARDWHYYFDTSEVLTGYGDNGDAYLKDRILFHALSWLLNCLGEEIENDEKPYRSLEYIRDYVIK